MLFYQFAYHNIGVSSVIYCMALLLWEQLGSLNSQSRHVMSSSVQYLHTFMCHTPCPWNKPVENSTNWQLFQMLLLDEFMLLKGEGYSKDVQLPGSYGNID